MQLSLNLAAGKRCCTCRQTKSTTEFRRNKNAPDGLSWRCKRCASAANKAWAARNSDHKKTVQAAWVAANKQRLREVRRRRYEANTARIRAVADDWARRNPDRAREIARRADAKRRAKKRGAPSTMTKRDLAAIVECFGGACAYCLRTDLPLQIDHVTAIESGGWDVPENVVPACKSCNSRKQARGVLYMLNRCESAR